jgi:molybdopterin synthase sulfur carrier subunit
MTRQADSSASPQITVKVFGGLRERSGQSILPVPFTPGMTIDGLLAGFDSSRPDLASALRRGLSDGYLHVLVNGRNVRFLEGQKTKLAPDDSVAFLPPIGGG